MNCPDVIVSWQHNGHNDRRSRQETLERHSEKGTPRDRRKGREIRLGWDDARAALGRDEAPGKEVQEKLLPGAASGVVWGDGTVPQVRGMRQSNRRGLYRHQDPTDDAQGTHAHRAPALARRLPGEIQDQTPFTARRPLYELKPRIASSDSCRIAIAFICSLKNNNLRFCNFTSAMLRL